MWNIEEYRRELKEIVNLDSGSRNLEGIRKVCRILRDKLADAGMRTETFDDGTRLQAWNHSEDDYDILLVGHMDTVFPDGTAAQRPYEESGGYAHGPGVADMKGGLILVLHLVRRLLEERPDLKLCVAFNSDEEIGSGRSKDWLQALGRRSKHAFVFEPGRAGSCFVKSRKGCMDIAARFHGKASHAGIAPDKGASAVVEMARWITALTSLQNLEAGTSVNAGLVKGGTASNVIPDYAEAVFDVRVTDPAELQRVKDRAEELAASVQVEGVTVELNFSGECMPMNPSEVTMDMMRKLDQAAAELGLEIGWAATGGTSDANHIAGLGVPTICGCGPCGGNLHSEEEFLRLSSVEERLNLMYRLLSDL